MCVEMKHCTSFCVHVVSVVEGLKEEKQNIEYLVDYLQRLHNIELEAGYRRTQRLTTTQDESGCDVDQNLSVRVPPNQLPQLETQTTT